jgi:hypothetical protein
LLIIYGHDLKPFQERLEAAGVERNDKMKLITEGEHLHSTEPHHRQDFETMCYRLGVGETAERVSW